jgi:hypothetical protein
MDTLAGDCLCLTPILFTFSVQYSVYLYRLGAAKTGHPGAGQGSQPAAYLAWQADRLRLRVERTDAHKPVPHKPCKVTSMTLMRAVMLLTGSMDPAHMPAMGLWGFKSNQEDFLLHVPTLLTKLLVGCEKAR